MRTVLLSTSSLWNCGDDLIRIGLLELLQLKSDVRVLWWNRGQGIKNAYANDLNINLPLMDYFILAGTPQWVYSNERIYQYCLENQVPLSIIGVGMRNVQSKSQIKLMKQVAHSGLCEVTLARDEIAATTLKEFGFQNVQLMLDPAFFMRPLDVKVEQKGLNILGWRDQFNYDYAPGFISRFPLRAALGQLRRWLRRKKRMEQREKYNELMLQIFSTMPAHKLVIVHDNREIEEAESLFGSEYVFYSTDYRRLLEKYAGARMYVGSRIHGATSAIIHGAYVHLIYTNNKAKVLENSVCILSSYSKDIASRIKVSYFGNEEIDLAGFSGEVSNQKVLQEAIRREKQRIRSVLLESSDLSRFMS